MNGPETVRRQVEEALLDVQTETVNLIYLRLGADGHGPAPSTDIPLEEPPGALVELRKQGMIQHLGLSGAGPEVLADCERHGIAFVPYWPLASGKVLDDPALTARRLNATPPLYHSISHMKNRGVLHAPLTLASSD